MNKSINIEAERQIRAAIVELGGNLLSVGNHILQTPIAAYSQKSRYYHNDEHRNRVAAPISPALEYRLGGADLIKTANALKCLIGNYHDIIYLQIDNQYPPNTEDIIKQFIRKENNDLYVKDNIVASQNNNICALLNLFDLRPGDKILFDKTDDESSNKNICGNEFLSALIACQNLDSAGIPHKNIVQVIFGIAATVAFQGQESFEKLFQRLEDIDHHLNEHEIKLTKIIAAETANCDVGGFMYSSFECFISETWSIMPEHNKNLRNDDFTTSHYCNSLIKMKVFMRDILNTDNLFCHAYSYPTDDELNTMKQGVTKNISAGLLYIRIKLTAVGILDAIGNLVNFNKELHSLTYGLNIPESTPNRELNDKEKIVFKALQETENTSSAIHTKSPIALFLFNILNEETITKLARMTEKEVHINHEHHYISYLKEINQNISDLNFQTIINSLVQLAISTGDNIKADKIKAIPNILNIV